MRRRGYHDPAARRGAARLRGGLPPRELLGVGHGDLGLLEELVRRLHLLAVSLRLPAEATPLSRGLGLPRELELVAVQLGHVRPVVLQLPDRNRRVKMHLSL